MDPIAAPDVQIEPGGPQVAVTGSVAGGLTTFAWPVLVLTAGAGIVLGLVSVVANGCPTRQHVLATQGVRDAVFYLLGFYLGIVVYYLVTKPLISFLL